MVEQYKLGYIAEEHNITTKDGYILQIHRIFESPRWKNKKKKGIVFLQHGLLCSSDTWVMLGPGKDLGTHLYNVQKYFYNVTMKRVNQLET